MGVQIFELNNASSSLKSGCRSIVLLSEEFDGGDAGGGGLLEPMLKIKPEGLGIPEWTTVKNGLDHGQRISLAKRRIIEIRCRRKDRKI